MKCFSRLFCRMSGHGKGQNSGIHTGQTDTEKPRRLKEELGEGIYYEYDQVYNGLGGYRLSNVVLLKKDDPEFRRCIINDDGEIQGFPGIEEGEWTRALEFPLENRIRFGVWLGAYKDGRARFEWTLQPDGRYFEDEDGFGGENCEEITVGSYMDSDGNFTEPFRYIRL